MTYVAPQFRALPKTLTTRRLSLRLPDLADGDAVFHSFGGDPEAMRTMPFTCHRTAADSEEHLRVRIQGRAEGMCWHWLITRANDQAVLGMTGLGFEGHKAEVGFILNRAAWGNGYATEALLVVLDAAFALPSIRRVWGWCDVENYASARVMEKAGMAKEGLLRRYAILPNIGPEPRDAFLYAKV